MKFLGIRYKGLHMLAMIEIGSEWLRTIGFYYAYDRDARVMILDDLEKKSYDRNLC